MKDWSLMITPEGEYILFLDNRGCLDDKKSMCFKVSDEEAQRIIAKTGCLVEELPF